MKKSEKKINKKMNRIKVYNEHNLPTTHYSNFKDLQGDLKVILDENLEKLKKSIIEFGVFVPNFVWKNKDKLYTMDGHQRKKAFISLETEGYIDDMTGEVIKYKIPEIPYLTINAKNKKEAGKKLLQLNSKYGSINDETVFFEEFKIDVSYIDDIEIPELEDLNISFDDDMNFDDDYLNKKNLSERFLVPPFSVLDTKQGYWQDRKREWLKVGIKSEMGRKAESLPSGFDEDKYGKKMAQGTSIFDPVLTEIMYKWFCKNNGYIFDPFAGGSVRGIISSFLNYNYTGIELRNEQISANIKQSENILENNKPKWINGDSYDLNKIITNKEKKFDFIFSCPPYYDLEIYSKKEGELSNIKTYKEFLCRYFVIIEKSLELLKLNRFACFVVGDIRDKKGRYRNFVSDTIKGFIKNKNVCLYNEIILLNMIGTAPIRASSTFGKNRKTCKVHQNVLVFYKGDLNNISTEFENIEIDKDLISEQI